MKKIILHIGTPKSGTTALQNFLNNNRDVLEVYDFCYPLDEESKNTEITMGNGRVLYEYILENNKQKALDYINNILAIHHESNIILSSEGLYFYPEFIHQIIPHANIVIYFREQSEKIVSSYGQRIKGDTSFHKSINKHVNSILDGYEDKDHGNYFLDMWVKLYGKENITVRPYEFEQFKDGSIFSDFLFSINLKSHKDFIFPKKKINPSYSRNALEYKLLLNRLIKSDNRKMNQLIRELLQQFSETYPDKHKFQILTPQQKQDITNYFKQSNSYIAKKYLHREDGKLFYNNQQQKEEKFYHGLNIESIHDITRYLINQNHILLEYIIKLVIDGLKSEKREVQNAAYKLLPIFSLYKSYQFLNDNIIANQQKNKK